MNTSAERRSERKPRLDGKVAIVTGAGAGIGQASAIAFAHEGATVVCADLVAAAADNTAQRITAGGGRALPIAADLTVSAEIDRVVTSTLAAFGYLDIMFNNVGVGVFGKVHELSESDWDAVQSTTLKSVFLGSKAVLPHFLAQGHGNILNNASVLGISAIPSYGAYCAAKAGVILLTKAMALDYGPSIRVNCICPGATLSPRFQRVIDQSPDPAAAFALHAASNRALNRLADPAEIAQSALFLVSDESSFCTGTALVVDGGKTAGG
jgi:meso-butanediol dehydrogenase/(S,S)-butanediol dehydrogenase/diacetyl reductase